jgi:hypothetical protein
MKTSIVATASVHKAMINAAVGVRAATTTAIAMSAMVAAVRARISLASAATVIATMAEAENLGEAVSIDRVSSGATKAKAMVRTTIVLAAPSEVTTAAAVTMA